MGKDVPETLAIKPCELFVKKLVRPKLLDSTTNSILQAPAPDRTVKKMQCRSEPGSPGYCRKVPGSTSLVSSAKALFKTWVNISDSTMGDWLTAAANLMLTLYEAHKKM